MLCLATGIHYTLLHCSIYWVLQIYKYKLLLEFYVLYGKQQCVLLVYYVNSEFKVLEICALWKFMVFLFHSKPGPLSIVHFHRFLLMEFSFKEQIRHKCVRYTISGVEVTLKNARKYDIEATASSKSKTSPQLDLIHFWSNYVKYLQSNYVYTKKIYGCRAIFLCFCIGFWLKVLSPYVKWCYAKTYNSVYIYISFLKIFVTFPCIVPHILL